MKALRAFTVLALAAFSMPATAAAFFIDDTSPTDQIVITLNDFEFGFSINGTQVQQGLSNPATVTIDESTLFDPGTSPKPFTFDGSWELGGSIASKDQTIYFVEKNDPTVVSDILQFTYSEDTSGIGHLTGSFISDFENNLGTLPANADVVIEDGSPFDFSNTNISASVTSDVEAVPLPAAVWGGLALLAVLGGSRLARRRCLPA